MEVAAIIFVAAVPVVVSVVFAFMLESSFVVDHSMADRWLFMMMKTTR